MLCIVVAEHWDRLDALCKKIFHIAQPASSLKCGNSGVLRPYEPRVDAEVHPAPRDRSPYSSSDPQMVAGGSIGGRPMAGDEGRHSAGCGDLTAAGERLSALCLRPVDRSLAQESGPGRRPHRPGI